MINKNGKWIAKFRICLNVLLHYDKYRKIVGEQVKIVSTDGSKLIDRLGKEIGYVYGFEHENFKKPIIIHFPKTKEKFCFALNELEIIKMKNVGHVHTDTIDNLLSQIRKSIEKNIYDYKLGISSLNILVKYIDKLENNWNELKKFVEERIKFIQEEKADFEEDLYNNYETNKAEITIRGCNLTQLEDVQDKMQELEQGKDENNTTI